MTIAINIFVCVGGMTYIYGLAYCDNNIMYYCVCNLLAGCMAATIVMTMA